LTLHEQSRNMSDRVRRNKSAFFISKPPFIYHNTINAAVWQGNAKEFFLLRRTLPFLDKNRAFVV